MNDDFTAAQQHFAVVAGNGRVGDLKGVILDTADGGAIHIQLVRAACHALRQDNQFGHSLIDPIMFAARRKSN